MSVGVVAGWLARGDDDWLQMVRLGSIPISVRYRRRDRKHSEQTDLERFINGNIKYSFLYRSKTLMAPPPSSHLIFISCYCLDMFLGSF